MQFLLQVSIFYFALTALANASIISCGRGGSAKAQISSACKVIASGFVDNETQADLICADTTLHLGIASCYQRARVVLDGTESERSISAIIACSGDSDPNAIQGCLQSAQVIADGSLSQRSLSAAIACSGNSFGGSIQSCLQLAFAVSKGASAAEMSRQAAFACSGNASSNRVQYCIQSNIAEVAEESRIDLIKKLLP